MELPGYGPLHRPFRLLIPVFILSPVSVISDTPAASGTLVNCPLPDIEFETLRDREQNDYEDQKDPSGDTPKIYISRSVEHTTFYSEFKIS